MRYAVLLIYLLMVISVRCEGDLNITITNPKRFDGFGSQFQHVIDSVMYAELHGFKYVYTPFTRMEHNYDNDPEFLSKKEWLINFIDNFEVNSAENVLTPPHAIDFFEQNIEQCAQSESLKKIKRIFRANKEGADLSKDHLNIVIHLRRPNSHDSRVDGTDTPDAFFMNIINKLRALYAAKNPVFHIYSQGERESFKEFVGDDIVIHLNDSVEDSFAAMVLADVLVTGRSSFSYVAGILSEGTVYYTPFWHVPLPHWISVEDLLKS